MTKVKKVSESRTIMTEMIMPNDTNPMGNLMGGNLLRWMDIAAAICAGKHCESYVVTASVDHVSFQKAIHVGDVITLESLVTRAFNTSVEVFVEVTAADVKGGNPRKCNHAYFTFVGMDDLYNQFQYLRFCHFRAKKKSNLTVPTKEENSDCCLVVD
jgi:acyl-CoA hydrolase